MLIGMHNSHTEYYMSLSDLLTCICNTMTNQHASVILFNWQLLDTVVQFIFHCHSLQSCLQHIIRTQVLLLSYTELEHVLCCG